MPSHRHFASLTAAACFISVERSMTSTSLALLPFPFGDAASDIIGPTGEHPSPVELRLDPVAVTRLVSLSCPPEVSQVLVPPFLILHWISV